LINKIDYTEFLSQFPHHKNKNNKERILGLKHPIKKSFKDNTAMFNISLLGRGHIFGEEDAIKNRYYTKSCT